MQVSILPVGELGENVIDALEVDLRRAGVGVTTLPSQEVPLAAHNPEREQYCAPALLTMGRRAHGEHVLVVTEVDFYVDPLNFVFGQADVGGQAAVISLYRLSADDARLFRFRARVEGSPSRTWSQPGSRSLHGGELRDALLQRTGGHGPERTQSLF